MFTRIVLFCLFVPLVNGEPPGYHVRDRSKRQTDELSPGNWDNCREGGVAPRTRVDTTQRVEHLRSLFAENNISAYIIPSEDPHQSEHTSNYDKRREFISGFSGSAGIAVVTMTKAALWTDGRYFLQAEIEMDCNWILMRSGNVGVPGISEWLNTELSTGGNVGASPFLMRNSWWNYYQENLDTGINMTSISPELIDQIWTTNRPDQPNTVINALPMKYAGRSWQDKVNDTMMAMKKNNVDLLVVTNLDETAWLFNLRASDVLYIPFFLSYAVIDRPADSVILYLLNHAQKLTQDPSDPETMMTVSTHLNTGISGSCTGKTDRCVQVKEYAQTTVKQHVQSRAMAEDVNKVWVSFTCNHAIVSVIPEDKMYKQNTPMSFAKSKKNEIEEQGMRKAHIKDAVALISFMAKLETGVLNGEHWTELSAAEEFERFRGQQALNRGLSFATISASGSNGAIIHYIPSHATDKAITTEDMYLLDSGGQYLDGTTDVTRTFHFGHPTDFEKECYTRVLMGHIDLFQATWVKGRYGRELDVLARGPLWDAGLDYRHGTGHGIGMYLSFHEGPGFIGMSHGSYKSDYQLAENQFFSDEPGYYEDGKFGIRLENIIMVKNATTKYRFGGLHFLSFDHVTLVPYEPKLIDYSLLTYKQIQYLNDYNKMIRDIVGPELQRQDQTAGYNWMMAKTGVISTDTCSSAASMTRRTSALVVLLTMCTCFLTQNC